MRWSHANEVFLPVTSLNVTTGFFPSSSSPPTLQRKRSVLVWRRDLGSARVPPRPVRRSSWTREFTPVTPNPSPPSVSSRNPRPTAFPSSDPRPRCRSVPRRLVRPRQPCREPGREGTPASPSPHPRNRAPRHHGRCDARVVRLVGPPSARTAPTDSFIPGTGIWHWRLPLQHPRLLRRDHRLDLGPGRREEVARHRVLEGAGRRAQRAGSRQILRVFQPARQEAPGVGVPAA